MSKKSVAVRILGQEYRIRSDADEEWLQHVAACVDTAMSQVRERTKTVDTLDVALLTCLNLAREVLELREDHEVTRDSTAEAKQGERLRALIEMAESATSTGLSREGGSRRTRDTDTPLLTLPTGAEVDETQGSLLDPLEAPLAPSET